MANLYTRKDSNIRKTWLIFTLFLIAVIGFGWIFARIFGDSTILIIAVTFSIVMSIISYWFSDKIVLAMAKAKPVTKDSAPELYGIVEKLAKEAKLPMPKIYIVNEKAPNAFATGRNPKHAVVAVTAGILEKLNKEELEGVLAHELSHVANRDILVSTIAVVLFGFISIVSDFFLRSLFWQSMFGGRDRDRQMNPIFLIIGIALAILAPLAAMLMQLAISRKREFLADASGTILTKKPENLVQALIKISSDSTPMRAANNTTAHLWIDDPFKGKAKTNWFHKLFMTHPPTEERVKALRGMRI